MPSAFRDRYLAAPSFPAFLASAQLNAELWQAVWRSVRIADGDLARASALPAPFHLLVLTEDWCGDAVNTVPVVARLAELAPTLDLRVLGRDANPDLRDAHLTDGARSIPVVVVLDEAFEERGWWGPRPAELQRWVMGEGRVLEKAERYREARRWYARDRGASTVREILALLERAAGVTPWVPSR